MVKAFLLILMIAQLTACRNSDGAQVFGHYEIHSPGYVEKIKYLFAGITSYVIGSELDLKNDFTFKLITCGNIITGSWRQVDDKILLTVLTNNYRIDSLSKTWPKLKVGPDLISYTIEKKSLIRIDNSATSKSIEILYKKNPDTLINPY